MERPVDILAFGAHPDDVEIGVGGILAKHAKQGMVTGICNLTEAELSSNGSVEERRMETQKAALCLGVKVVCNLGFPDRGLVNTSQQRIAVIEIIRRLKPNVVLAPYWEDRHPDHVMCSQMVREAVFDAAITKKETSQDDMPHRVKHLYYYFLHESCKPQVVVDVTEVYQQKVEALLAYSSQFSRGLDQVDTPINSPTFLSMIRGRDGMWGHTIGATYGEALVSSQPIHLRSLL